MYMYVLVTTTQYSYVIINNVNVITPIIKNVGQVESKLWREEIRYIEKGL